MGEGGSRRAPIGMVEAEELSHEILEREKREMRQIPTKPAPETPPPSPPHPSVHLKTTLHIFLFTSSRSGLDAGFEAGFSRPALRASGVGSPAPETPTAWLSLASLNVGDKHWGFYLFIKKMKNEKLWAYKHH